MRTPNSIHILNALQSLLWEFGGSAFFGINLFME